MVLGWDSGACCPKITPYTSRRLYSRSLPIRSLLSLAIQASLAAYLPRSDTFSLGCWKQSGVECHSIMKSRTQSHNTAVVMTGAIVTLFKKKKRESQRQKAFLGLKDKQKWVLVQTHLLVLFWNDIQIHLGWNKKNGLCLSSDTSNVFLNWQVETALMFLLFKISYLLLRQWDFKHCENEHFVFTVLEPLELA